MKNSWYTHNEINFIKNIGTGKFSSLSARVKEKTRLELLQKYRYAADNRDEWGSVNYEEAIRFAEAEIHSLNGGGG